MTASQKAAQPAAMYLRTLASEPWDSGFDSDEPTPFRPSLEVSVSQPATCTLPTFSRGQYASSTNFSVGLAPGKNTAKLKWRKYIYE